MYKLRITKAGLTLIELLISVLLISVMLGAVWVIYQTGFDVYYGQISRENIKSAASLAFISMTNELRQAFSVTAATITSLTFTADIDGNGVNETIQYTWSGLAGAPLNRVAGSSTAALIRSVSSLAFTYYGANNALLNFPVTPSQVRLVLMDATSVSGSESFHLRTKVQLQCI